MHWSYSVQHQCRFFETQCMLSWSCCLSVALADLCVVRFCAQCEHTRCWSMWLWNLSRPKTRRAGPCLKLSATVISVMWSIACGSFCSVLTRNVIKCKTLWNANQTSLTKSSWNLLHYQQVLYHSYSGLGLPGNMQCEQKLKDCYWAKILMNITLTMDSGGSEDSWCLFALYTFCTVYISYIPALTLANLQSLRHRSEQTS